MVAAQAVEVEVVAAADGEKCKNMNTQFSFKKPNYVIKLKWDYLCG